MLVDMHLSEVGEDVLCYAGGHPGSFDMAELISKIKIVEGRVGVFTKSNALCSRGTRWYISDKALRYAELL